MSKSVRLALTSLMVAMGCVCVSGAGQADPYVGRWALTIPGGGAGWLGVTPVSYTHLTLPTIYSV